VLALRKPLLTARVKLYIESTRVPGWNEIDAVGVKDDQGKLHWAVAADASTTFAQPAPPPAAGADRERRIRELEREVRELREQLRKLEEMLDKKDR
jgi:hypothetical protein